MQFVEREPIEAGFAKLYQTQIRPILAGLERDRRRRNLIAWLWFAVIAGIGGGITLMIALLFDWSFVGFAGILIVLVMTLLTLILAFGTRQGIARRWRRGAAARIMPVIATHLGDLRFAADGTGFPLKEFTQHALVKYFEKADLNQRLSGQWQGRAFDLVSAVMTRKSGGERGRSLGFRGLLIRAHLPRPAPTRLRIGLNLGNTLNELSGAFSGLVGLHPVRTGHTGFDRQFAIYAEDPQAARRWLTPAMLADFAALGRSEMAGGDETLRAAIEGDTVWLALRRKRPFLELGRLGQPVGSLEDDLHALFSDLQMIRTILDRLPR